MSTTLAKKETVERKWYVLDAAGKPMTKGEMRNALYIPCNHKGEGRRHV